MAKEIQYRGNCPCCGRQQAVTGGLMAKHGYTVKHGWFEGVCPGAGRKPMQVDRAFTDNMVADIREEVEELEVKAAELRAGKIFPELAKDGYEWATDARGVKRRKDKMVPFAEAKDFAKREAVDFAAYQCENRARMGKGFANEMEALVNAVYGKPLVEVPKGGKPGIQVGDEIKLWGEVFTVKAIKDMVARGVGPALNGQYVEHVCFERNGNEVCYPKRYARLVK